MRSMLALALALPACKDDGAPDDSPTSPYPEGLAPLGDCTAPAPTGTAEEPWPETYELRSDGEADPYWAHVRGYVHASVAETWAALRVAEVNVDRRSAVAWTVEDYEATPYDFAYLLHVTIQDVVEVEMDVEWRHGAIEGSVDAPTEVAIRYDKIDGTIFVPLLEGSILLHRVTDEVTELELIQNMQSAAPGLDKLEASTTDLFNEVVLTVHGQPLPEYE